MADDADISQAQDTELSEPIPTDPNLVTLGHVASVLLPPVVI